RGIRNYSRAFDEIVYSCDSTTSNNDPVCISPTPAKHDIT
ncbi:unnamed protein product, partial [Rotaria socialis]